MARMTWASGAVVLAMTTSVGVADEPTVLSHLELDAVTAAGVLVDVKSFAGAAGYHTQTLTDEDTFAVAGETFDLGVGLTLGHGYACCGAPAEVEIGSAVLGVGDVVRRGTRSLEYDDGISAQALSAGYVVALSFHEPLLRSRELRPALADLRMEFATQGHNDSVQ